MVSKDLMRKCILMSCLIYNLLFLTFGYAQQTPPCRNLGKVNDIDDLFFQFYSNLDSHCLFEIPTAELEKIWGIRVFNVTSNASPEEKAASDNSYEHEKTKEALFVLKLDDNKENIPYFELSMTFSYARKHGWGGSIAQGQYPKLLPPPQIINKRFDSEMISYDYVETAHKDTVYRKESLYYWLNQANSDEQPVLVIYTSYSANRPSGFFLYSKARALHFK